MERHRPRAKGLKTKAYYLGDNATSPTKVSIEGVRIKSVILSIPLSAGAGLETLKKKVAVKREARGWGLLYFSFVMMQYAVMSAISSGLDEVLNLGALSDHPTESLGLAAGNGACGQ